MRANKDVLDEIYNLNQTLLREMKCDSFRLVWVHKEEALYMVKITNTGVINKFDKPIYTMTNKDGSLDGIIIIAKDTMDNDEILNYLNGVRTGLMILHNHLEIQASAVIAALQKQNKARGIQPN